MAAVNFYRFASAMMELLEPDKYSLANNQQVIQKAVQNSDQQSSVASAPNNTQELTSNAKTGGVLTLVTKNSFDQANLSQLSETQIKTSETAVVDAVTANLSKAIANASDDKLVQVAQAIKDAAIDATPSNAFQQTTLTAVISQAKFAENMTDVSAIVQATVSAIAEQTTENIKQLETAESVAQSGGMPLVIASEVKTIDVVTSALTDKIKEKSAPEAIKITIEDSIQKVPDKYLEQTEEATSDFWEQIPEIESSKIENYNELLYFYNFMKDGSILDIFNPEIDLNERYKNISDVMGLANNRYNIDSNFTNAIEKNETICDDRTKENERNNQELADRRKMGEVMQFQLERKKLEERIAIERLKDVI